MIHFRKVLSAGAHETSTPLGCPPGCPPELARSIWRGDQLAAHSVRALPSGYSKLDAQLPGQGWPVGTLTELLMAANGIGEIRLLAPALRTLSQANRQLVLLGPPHLPYGPALAAMGIRPERVIVVQADKPGDRLWAVEQTLKASSFGALLAWLPQARPDQLRRLQLAAQGADGLTFVFRPLPAQFESSPAPLRLVCTAARVPLEGIDERKLMVRIVKRRGPVLAEAFAIDLPQPVAARASRGVPTTAASTSLSPIDALDRARLPVSADRSLLPQ